VHGTFRRICEQHQLNWQMSSNLCRCMTKAALELPATDFHRVTCQRIQICLQTAPLKSFCDRADHNIDMSRPKAELMSNRASCPPGSGFFRRRNRKPIHKLVEILPVSPLWTAGSFAEVMPLGIPLETFVCTDGIWQGIFDLCGKIGAEERLTQLCLYRLVCKRWNSILRGLVTIRPTEAMVVGNCILQRPVEQFIASGRVTYDIPDPVRGNGFTVPSPCSETGTFSSNWSC
jgi:hypothetical protein